MLFVFCSSSSTGPRGQVVQKQRAKTYNTGDLLVVTDPTTDPAVVKLFFKVNGFHSYEMNPYPWDSGP